MCLEIIQKLAYTSTPDEYDKLYSQFEKGCPKKVVEYFNENWHQIKDDWVLGYKADLTVVVFQI